MVMKDRALGGPYVPANLVCRAALISSVAGAWKPLCPRSILSDMGLGAVDIGAGVVHGDVAGRKLDAVGT